MSIMRFGWMALLGLTALGCSGDDDDDSAPLEVIGEWQTSFGTETFDETITAKEWGLTAIVEYDNAKNVVITQNPDGDDEAALPNTFSRIVYLEPEDDAFYYCTTDYGLETLKEAQQADSAVDDSNPDIAGCGDFPWTLLTKK